MSTWVSVLDTDVLPAASAERASIAAIRGGDDLLSFAAEAVATFRGAIDGRGHSLGPAGTVPPGLKHYAIAMALWHWVSEGVPENDRLQTKARRDNAKEAEEALQAIREGRLTPELPDGYSGPGRVGSWNSENRILSRTHPVPPPSTQWQSADESQEPYANPNAPSDD